MWNRLSFKMMSEPSVQTMSIGQTWLPHWMLSVDTVSGARKIRQKNPWSLTQRLWEWLLPQDVRAAQRYLRRLDVHLV